MSVLSPEKIVLVSSLRIPREEREKDLFYYDVRHADDCGFTPAEISEFVMVNHMFTIALKEPLKLNNGFLILDEKDKEILFSIF